MFDMDMSPLHEQVHSLVSALHRGCCRVYSFRVGSRVALLITLYPGCTDGSMRLQREWGLLLCE